MTTPFQAIREIAPDSHLYRKYGKEAPRHGRSISASSPPFIAVHLVEIAK
jgi:hypothetical protein